MLGEVLLSLDIDSLSLEEESSSFIILLESYFMLDLMGEPLLFEPIFSVLLLSLLSLKSNSSN